MNVTVESQPDCKASVWVEVPAERAAGVRQKIFNSYKSKARLPGFRPGKAPAKVIESRFGKAIDEDLEERLVQDTWREAVEQESLKVLSIHGIDEPTLHEDGRFTFTVRISTVPEFELPEYKGITVRLPRLEIGDRQVDHSLESARERFSDFKEVDDRPLAMGDIAVIDYEGSLDGVPLAEAAPEAGAQIAGAKGFWLKMDEEGFLPGFCNGLVDAAVGEEREIQVVLGDELPIESLHGKELRYAVQLTGIKEQVLPEIDDAFAARVEPGKTLEELRETVLQDLNTQWAQQLDAQKTNQIVAFLDSAVDFEIPSEVMRDETERRANEIAMEAVQDGVGEEEIMEQQDDIVEAAGGHARVRVKTSFILDQIAEKEEIEVTNKELVSAVASLAARNGVPAKQYMKQVQKEGRIPQIAEIIRTEKAMQFLKEHATIEEIDPPSPGEELPEAPGGDPVEAGETAPAGADPDERAEG